MKLQTKIYMVKDECICTWRYRLLARGKMMKKQRKNKII